MEASQNTPMNGTDAAALSTMAQRLAAELASLEAALAKEGPSRNGAAAEHSKPIAESSGEGGMAALEQLVPRVTAMTTLATEHADAGALLRARVPELEVRSIPSLV